MLTKESTTTHAVTTKTGGVELTDHGASRSPGKNGTECQDSGDTECQDNETAECEGNVLPDEKEERGEESMHEDDVADSERGHGRDTSEALYDIVQVVATKGATKGATQ
eukprot:294227_1